VPRGEERVLFERIESAGLAHYSYLVADRSEAIVIDPRRDSEVYVRAAARAGARVAHVVETHRNEDYVVGSLELAHSTGAAVWHADAEMGYGYGEAATDGQTWSVGRLRIHAMSTPGHTPGSMSYLLDDPSGAPWVIFTGDALFAGDVGRVDLPGTDRIPEMARLLHASLFERILALDDGVIVCPSHGAGSVCGGAIAERVWTTIGLEKKLNPKLRVRDRAGFVAEVGVELPRPPYFRMMETLNLEGPPVLGAVPRPRPLGPEEFEREAKRCQILDTRSELAFGAAHVEGALSIWAEGLASQGGWFLDYDRPILLVNEGEDRDDVTRTLLRMGYDEIAGTLAGGMLAWEISGRSVRSIDTVSVEGLCSLLDAGEDLWILDVRRQDELEHDGVIRGAQQVPLHELAGRSGEVPRDRRVHIFCGSGLRSMIAASYLTARGLRDVAVILGGLAGWRSSSCPLDLP
jgi:hydroxyacylglutathione hydrolase